MHISLTVGWGTGNDYQSSKRKKFAKRNEANTGNGTKSFEDIEDIIHVYMSIRTKLLYQTGLSLYIHLMAT